MRFLDPLDDESRRGGARSSRVILWLLCALLPAEASAGNYPVSAFSTSLRMPPELVDESSLLFQHPHRAGSTGTRILAYNTSYSSYPPLGFYVPGFTVSTETPAIGVVGSTGAHGVFLLAQPSVLDPNTAKLQIGWGAAWSWLRVGLAARHERNSSESHSMRSFPGSGGVLYETASGYSVTSTVWEVALGLGVGSEKIDFDVALDLVRDEDMIEEYAYALDSLAAAARTDNEPSPHLAARLRARIGGEAEIVVAGRWGRADADLFGTAIDGDTVVHYLVPRTFENWSAGIGVFFSAGQLDWLGISATWEHLEAPDFYYFAVPGKKSLEHVACAFALRQRLWNELWVQAGTVFRYIEPTRESVDPRPSNRSRHEEQQQSFTSDFAWGASYSWKYVDVRTTVSDTVDFDNLFLSLDVIVHP